MAGNVAIDGATSPTITEPTPGNLIVTGTITVGTTPTLVVKEVDNPSAFARTAFIEALQRAGVTVSAPATGANPESALPPAAATSRRTRSAPNSSAAGHAQVKTGNRVVGTPADQLIVLGNSLAGTIRAKSGRSLTFMIAVGNVPVATPAEFLTITDEQAQMIVAIQQSY